MPTRQIAVTDTPFQCGSDVCVFPDLTLHKLVIRVQEGTPGEFKVYLTFHEDIEPSASLANCFLNEGEALTIDFQNYGIDNAKKVKVKAITGDPKIFWYLH